MFIMSYENHYKDREPQETVEIVRNKLLKWGIEITENWFSSVAGLYSLRIEIKGTTIGANGKGITEEYALASAYGELCERLSLMLPFRMNGCREYMVQGMDYEYGAEEKRVWKIDDKSWFEKALNEEEKKYFLNNEKVLADENKKIVSSPFNSLSNAQIWVPIKLQEVVYGSNGMAAGNSFEEAMVQGLSEIIERYAGELASENKEYFPDITRYIIGKFKHIENIIEKFSEVEDGKFEIMVKDLSMEKNLPVVAVVLIDKEKNAYFVNLGCHPKIEIAVERAFTELMQGRDIKNFLGMTPITASLLEISSEKNRHSILSDGNGIYNITFFAKTEDSIPKSSLWYHESNDNKDLLLELISLIENMEFEVYYNYTKFMGLHAVHIIVPGMSELTKNPSQYFKENERVEKIKNYIRNIENINEAEIRELISFFSAKEKEYNLQDLFDLPVAQGSSLENYRRNLLLIMLHTYSHNYKEAYKYATEWNKELVENHQEKGVIDYYQAITSVLGCKMANLEDDKIIDCLSVFFTRELLMECMEDMKDSNIFTYIPYVECDNCKECSVENECKYRREKEVYKILIQQKNRAYELSK